MLLGQSGRKFDFRFHAPEALADFCTSKELG